MSVAFSVQNGIFLSPAILPAYAGEMSCANRCLFGDLLILISMKLDLVLLSHHPACLVKANVVVINSQYSAMETYWSTSCASHEEL